MSDDLYNSHAARLDTIIGGDSSHYIRLRKCKEEYDQLADAVPVGQGFLTFDDFAREWYGVKMCIDRETSGFALDYQVVDEKKYTVFLLKFST
jgi:RNA polymerase subunit RPABC4/transcription elongation factor Spt4